MHNHSAVPLACFRPGFHSAEQLFAWQQLLVRDVASAQGGFPEVIQKVASLMPAAMNVQPVVSAVWQGVQCTGRSSSGHWRCACKA